MYLLMIYYIVNVREDGFLMMMCQHAVTVENGSEQFSGSIIVDSVVAFSAPSVVTKRSAAHLLIA